MVRFPGLSRLLLAVALALSPAFVLWVALEAAGAGAVGSPVSAPGQGTIVRCEPAWITVPVGLVVSLDLYVQDVGGLYAADLQLSSTRRWSGWSMQIKTRRCPDTAVVRFPQARFRRAQGG